MSVFFQLPGIRRVGYCVYRFISADKPRQQSLVTYFFRNLNQLSVFEGPLHHLASQDSMRILVLGCSYGCEVYTIAGYLDHCFPGLDWEILAGDIDETALAYASVALYDDSFGIENTQHPLAQPIKNKLFITALEKSNAYQIHPKIRKRVTIKYLNALDEQLKNKIGNFDVVFGQNFLIHMNDTIAKTTFHNMISLVRPGGSLFVNGMDLDLRTREAKEAALIPIDYKVREIHDEDHLRRSQWPFEYWGLEPLCAGNKDAKWRYATIFSRSLSLAHES